MAETLSNINIVDYEWRDINNLSGVAIGNSFRINNTGRGIVKLIESSNQPTITDSRGAILSPYWFPTSSARVPSGSLTIWAKSLAPLGSTLMIQE
jgi:hypothetical protein